MTQVNDSRLGQIDYQYDPVGRLVRTQGERLKESFQFDPAGNLLDAAAGQHGQIKNNLIQQYQGASYRYDHQGNVVEKQHQGQSLKLYWDNLNRLASSELNGQTTHYGYDVFGRRLFKQTQRDLTLFGWDGDLMIWESFKANNNIQSYTKHYLYEPDSFVPLVQTGYTGFIKLLDTPDYRQYQTQAYVRDQDPLWKTDTRYKRAEIERAIFYHCDQVGTPQVLSNESGEQVWAVTLDTWGQALEIKASDHLLEQTNIRFQGQYYDAETGLHYNRYRYYEPHSARYIGKDPIGLEGGINTSAYVSDPNAWIDPMGLQQNDNRGLFWISPEALKESDKATRQMEENARRNPNTKSNYENIMSGEGASIPKPKIVETPVMQHFSPPLQKVMPPESGMLGTLFPGTMSGFAKIPNTAAALRNQSMMRNITYGGAAVAASPYAAAVGGGAFGAEVKVPIMGAVGAAGIDGGFQSFESIMCECNVFDYKRTLGVATVGALTAGTGANLALVNGVEYVTFFNFYKNATNTVGTKIFYGQTAANAVIAMPLKEEQHYELKDIDHRNK